MSKDLGGEGRKPKRGSGGRTFPAEARAGAKALGSMWHA